MAEHSRTAGVAVVVVVGSGVLAGAWSAAPDIALLALWVVGTGAVWWSVSRTSNPAPPPVPEGAGNASPQFTVVDDKNNPHHSIVVWNDEEGTK